MLGICWDRLRYYDGKGTEEAPPGNMAKEPPNHLYECSLR